ncbi:hypothetical protein [Sulfitobacter sp. R18_1]|uniref:hypothetical protein n=1 Tax=Sulfitobacter sp. R18_1 TaxID=2821104 RepID=UPI001ADC9C19|nr:hypothetical protein [Sulfitobacter sp. R18_1]MBO9431113.1 hypothetical protein [Sulfitobacter sp. R18_1]
MNPETIAAAYPDLFPRRVQRAHMALLTWAEEANPDRWPTPPDVCRFARLYGVPRATLGALVGMLSMRHDSQTRETWVDAVRRPEDAPPHLIQRHSRDVIRAFGWFCATTDLGWLRLPSPTIH